MGFCSETQLFEGTQPSSDKFRPISNISHVKPRGGLWTCPYLGPPDYSAWVQWCVAEEFRGPEFDLWLLTPCSDIKILTIQDLETWEALPSDPSTPEMKHYQVIDYETLAAEWDGMALSQEMVNRYRLEWDFRYHTTLYSWDVESTLWFRWVFEDVKSLGKVRIRGGQ